MFDRTKHNQSLHTTHGLTTTKLKRKIYSAWLDAKRRCYNPEHSEYARYGAVGIFVADYWIKDPLAFYEYACKLPEISLDLSLDRVDNNMGYVEGNLRWATKAEQVRNRGKPVNNSSGITGVSFHTNQKGLTYVMARWKSLADKQMSKTFTVSKHGLLPAFKMACDYREKMIAELNAQGAGYTENHGK